MTQSEWSARSVSQSALRFIVRLGRDGSAGAPLVPDRGTVTERLGAVRHHPATRPALGPTGHALGRG